MANLRGLAVCLLLAGALLASCGGSSKSSSSAPTKAQYVAKADAICEAVGRKTAPLLSKLEASGPALLAGSATAAHEAAPLLRELHSEASASLSQLRALRAPKGDGAAIERFLSPLTNVVAAAGQAASSVSAGNASSALGLLAQVETDAQRANSAARAYGVAPCGSVVSAIG